MITFAERPEPLAVAAVFARGEAARALATKLRARLPLPGVAAVRAGEVIVAIGEALPWVEGAIWLGREPSAPALLIPTRLELAPHPALVLAALERRGAAPPIALVPVIEAGVVAVPLGAARAPGDEELAAFLAEGAP